MRRPFGYVLGFSLLLLFCAPGSARAELSKDRLTPQHRLAIVRDLAYEYATALQPLPASQKEKEALKLGPDGEIDEDNLRRVLASRGAAVHSGELVQITGIDFERDYILFEINGGGKKKKKWWERIRVQGGVVGTMPPPQSPVPPKAEPPGGGEIRPGTGSWIQLQFPHLLPDMTAEEVKEMLSQVLDFSSQESPTTRWIDTIEEKYRKAIEEQRAIPGMNHRMVLAALGRPHSKVRETKNGIEYEDWIYGYPPMTTFVTFVGDEVVEVKEFK